MDSATTVGLLVGIGTLAACATALFRIYRHPGRFAWLDLTAEMPRPTPPASPDRAASPDRGHAVTAPAPARVLG